MKKFLIIFLMIAISGGVLLKFSLFNDDKELDKPQQAITDKTKAVDEVELSDEDREISSTIIEKEMSKNVEENTEKLKQEEMQQKQDTKIEVEQRKQEDKAEVVEEVPDNLEETTNDISSNKEPEISEPKQEEIFYDDGYYKLKKGLFDTESECWYKGMEVSLTDTVNIAGSYCESVAYKGKIIGYKLYIKYSSGKMEQYLNE